MTYCVLGIKSIKCQHSRRDVNNTVCPSVTLVFCVRTAKQSSFLQGVSIACYASPVLAIVGWLGCLSVCCLSVHHTLPLSENDASIGSRNLHRRIVQGLEIKKNSSRNSKWFGLSEGVRMGYGKISNFQPVSRRISERVQDSTKVTIND